MASIEENDDDIARMNCLEDFEAALRVNPHRWAVRLAYAEWLEEPNGGNNRIHANGQRHQAEHQKSPWHQGTDRWLWLQVNQTNRDDHPFAQLPDRVFDQVKILQRAETPGYDMWRVFETRQEAERCLALALQTLDPV